MPTPKKQNIICNRAMEMIFVEGYNQAVGENDQNRPSKEEVLKIIGEYSKDKDVVKKLSEALYKRIWE